MRLLGLFYGDFTFTFTFKWLPDISIFEAESIKLRRKNIAVMRQRTEYTEWRT